MFSLFDFEMDWVAAREVCRRRRSLGRRRCCWYVRGTGASACAVGGMGYGPARSWVWTCMAGGPARWLTAAVTPRSWCDVVNGRAWDV